MKKTLLILSAVAVSGTALLVAQDREAPRGDRPRGGGMFANSPFFKKLGMNEEGEIALPKADDEEAKKAFLAKIMECDTDKDGKLTRTEIFGEFRRGGGAGGAGGRGGAEGGRQRPAAE